MHVQPDEQTGHLIIGGMGEQHLEIIIDRLKREFGVEGASGSIQGQEDRGGAQIIQAHVPLSEMFGYATDLRSRTKGRGTYAIFLRLLRPPKTRPALTS